MKKKYFYLYEIRNKINDKVYIGVHQTYDLDDGYMGSGTHLKRVQEKYGLENFEKEILFFFDSEDSMFSKEKEIVTTEFVLREDTYNLTEGGRGCGIEATRKGGKVAGYNAYKAGTKIFTKECKEMSLINLKEWRESPEGKENSRRVVKLACKAALASEAQEKRKETFKAIKHQQGEKNSQFGKMWITNGIENTRIMKDETIPEGWRKGRVNVVSEEKKEELRKKGKLRWDSKNAYR